MTALDPRLHAFRPDLADATLAGRVDAARFVAGQPYVVSAPRAPVRRAPSLDAMLLTEALCGEQVTVFDTRDGWAWGQLVADRYVGWLPQDVLAEPGSAPTHEVRAVRTFAFCAPDIKSVPRCALPYRARVTVLGEAKDKNARYALIAPEGAVVTQHLVPIGTVETDWAGVAERFRGTPYLWGGKTSLGIDCSGLVQIALSACGIAAPRDTDMQEAALGQALPLGAGLPPLRRGDLVFWKGHVGIMCDGETLLHANAHHMEVAAEPVGAAAERLAGRGAPITSIRRVERE